MPAVRAVAELESLGRLADMPLINIIKCRKCGVAFPPGWGGYTYASADDGSRVVCPHPREFDRAKEVTGLEWSAAQAAGRIGFNSYCMCFSCGHQFELDLDRDIKRCPKCAALEVRSARGTLACKCPHCHEGDFYEESTGMVS